MSKQQHDLGRRKRLAALEAAKDAPLGPAHYARDLVKRGLASPMILARHERPKEIRRERHY